MGGRPSLPRAVTFAFGLVVVLGIVAVISREPFVFPSLGPTIFVLTRRWRTRQARLRAVLGGHVVGACVGFVAFRSLLGDAGPLLSPLGSQSFPYMVSGAIATALTILIMARVDIEHAPACSTALTFALGFMRAPLDIVWTVMAVGLAWSAWRLLVGQRPSATATPKRYRGAP